MMRAFGSFAVSDVATARKFYEETLGMGVEWIAGEGGPIWIKGGDDQRVMVYERPGHTPAEFTVLNIEVQDIDGAVDELTSRGVAFERYEGMDLDDRGISRTEGYNAAWLKDPSGNVVAIINMS